MSFGGCVRRIGYRMRDFVKNPKEVRICPQWKEIKETLSDYQTGWPKVEKSLENCLRYAVQHTEFYRKMDTGKPLKLKDFPVLNKLDFIENYNKIRNPLFPDEVCHVSTTSGSTGTPFFVHQDVGKRNRVLAELQAFGEFAGYPSHEKMIFYRALSTVSYWSMFWSNVWQRDITFLSGKDIKEIMKEQSGNLYAIGAYASTLDILTNHCVAENLQGSDSVKVVFSGAEFLSQPVRERVRKVWKNAVAVSRYSNMENGVLAQENGTPDVFQLCWPSYYFEVLKFDSDEPAEEGELGRIVITDMYNKAFPMIRSDTGDAARLVHKKGEFPVLADVVGRRIDLILDTKGNFISPHGITYAMWGVEGDILQWQFAQEGQKQYRVLYCSENQKESREGVIKKIPALKKVLGEDAVIEIEQVENIPVLASGKRKMIVQKWKKI